MCKDIVSIIVPIYKAEEFLKDCLYSILNQSYKYWECILVDDGSPDKSGEICDFFSKLDNRFHVFHKKNGGVTSARKLGIEKSKGKWISFVDSDDYLPYNSLELLIKESKKVESEIIIGAWEKQVGHSSRIIPLMTNGIHCSSNIIKAFLYGKCYSGPVGKLYRRQLFDCNTFNISADIKLNEDLIMNIKLASKANRIVCNSKIIVYRYISRPGSASHNISSNNWDLTFEELHKVIPSTLETEYCHYIAIILHKYKEVKTSYKTYLEKSISKGVADYYTRCVLNVIEKKCVVSICYLYLYDFTTKLFKSPIIIWYYLKILRTHFNQVKLSMLHNLFIGSIL